MNYYNEFDPRAAAWLRELIKAGLIPDGDVDERSIAEVQPDEIEGYTQCHFFAGIGGWSLALEQAGWATDRAVWTGSVPCQPFSAAGKQKGTADERHLWPEFYRLIRQCQPATVFGEQVASKLGRGWLAGVFADLETLGYAVAGTDLCAAGLGAPHIRQRLWWVADSRCEQSRQGRITGSKAGTGEKSGPGLGSRGADSGLADAQRERRRQWPAGQQDANNVARPSQDAWRGVYVPCADGKSRRIESGLEPLVNGLPNRASLLRGYGNAVVPQVGAAFVTAYMEALGDD